MKKALIAMSGGVDSSVAAYFMVQNGYECIGITMKLFCNEDIGRTKEYTCCSLDDIEDARKVARKLGFEHYVFNFTTDFKSQVIDRFISVYESGGTPNPCIDCNRYIKFERLFNRAKSLECDYIVTGHYARVEYKDNRYLLKKALDETKDQSYVLYSMTQEQLAHTIFPLGELQKSQTREIAHTQGFINADKHDSQDICFVPNGDYASIIKLHTGKTYPGGNFIDTLGNVIGNHKGIINYTIGQRKGLGISSKAPLYVCRIDPITNNITLGSNENTFTKEFYAEQFNWIAYDTPSSPLNLKAKIRYKQPEQKAKITPLPGNRAHIIFDEPQRAVTRGQSVVLYDGDIVVGGGIII